MKHRAGPRPQSPRPCDHSRRSAAFSSGLTRPETLAPDLADLLIRQPHRPIPHPPHSYPCESQNSGQPYRNCLPYANLFDPALEVQPDRIVVAHQERMAVLSVKQQHAGRGPLRRDSAVRAFQFQSLADQVAALLKSLKAPINGYVLIGLGLGLACGFGVATGEGIGMAVGVATSVTP